MRDLPISPQKKVSIRPRSLEEEQKKRRRSKEKNESNERAHLMSKASQGRRSSYGGRSIERRSHSESVGDVVSEVGDCKPKSVSSTSTRLFFLPRAFTPSRAPCDTLTKVQVSSSLRSLPSSSSSSSSCYVFLSSDHNLSLSTSTSFPQLPVRVRILLQYRRTLPTRGSTVRVSVRVSGGLFISVFSEGGEISHRLWKRERERERAKRVSLV